VSAELPAHFSESLATLGFDPLAGDSLSLEQPALPSRETKQRKAAAAAKAKRRERRGERRSRGSQPKRGRR
jgi:23S rRNA pseudouridine955/2504/2580 synthase